MCFILHVQGPPTPLPKRYLPNQISKVQTQTNLLRKLPTVENVSDVSAMFKIVRIELCREDYALHMELSARRVHTKDAIKMSKRQDCVALMDLLESDAKWKDAGRYLCKVVGALHMVRKKSCAV
mmetsp:Transcript_29093/g.43162  ORF Transcript_29093/g.43162 Transcript_29093/m.43162 type:complete len:124 (+) Transcript_29093:151-522(+)